MARIPYIGISITGYTWTQLNDHPYSQDGQFACKLGSNSYTIGGWTTGATSHKRVYKSADLITWNQLTDAPWTARHTFGQFVKNDIAYIVGGDPFTPASDSWKFENDVWTQLSADCGIGNRSLMGSVVHNEDFYLIGGQSSIQGTGTLFREVLKSTDNGVTFNVIKSNTPFGIGNCYGNPVSFGGYIWIFTGGIYDDSGEWFQYQKGAWKSLNGIDWEYVGITPFNALQYPQVTVWDSKMWITGGFNYFLKNKTGFDTQGNTNKVYCSSNGTEWKELESTPWLPRHAHSTFVDGDNLILLNGSDVASIARDEVWKLSKD